MRQKQRFDCVLAWFEANMPVAESELHYENPYQLLVAVMLSAQCTDKRVNMVTPALFEAFPNPQKLADATVEQVLHYIRSISYPNSKAEHLVGMARILVAQHNGEVPDNRKDLEALPGVGRKTANVILAIIFQQPTMAVDTHVFRVAERIGLTTNSKTPLHTENVLTKNIPLHLIPKAHHWLILHGRYVCMARKPKCETCGIKTYCRYYNNNNLKA
jgi:endonuclease-3